MADVILNSPIESISGTLDGKVYRRCGDRTVIARKPKPRETPPTEAELANQARFRLAHEYGKSVKDDPERRAPYERTARKQKKAVYHIAHSDFMIMPTVEHIDACGYTGSSGDVVSIIAEDNVEVVGVNVVLSNLDGEVIEEGEAVVGVGSRWTYTATQSVPAGATVRIVATATDRAGGSHTHEVETTV